MKKKGGLTGPAMATVIAVLIIAAGINVALSNVDIDYSHNVVGTGTVMTDFRMGSSESSVATGVVHGTGDVTDRYIFQSNSSGNLTIQDQFLFTKSPAYKEITIRDYPPLNNTSGNLHLLGPIWAGKINLSMQ
jgi:hypothetical protein